MICHGVIFKVKGSTCQGVKPMLCLGKASEQKSATCRVVPEFVPGDPIFTGFFYALSGIAGGKIGRMGP